MSDMPHLPRLEAEWVMGQGGEKFPFLKSFLAGMCRPQLPPRGHGPPPSHCTSSDSSLLEEGSGT